MTLGTLAPMAIETSIAITKSLKACRKILEPVSYLIKSAYMSRSGFPRCVPRKRDDTVLSLTGVELIYTLIKCRNLRGYGASYTGVRLASPPATVCLQAARLAARGDAAAAPV